MADRTRRAYTSSGSSAARDRSAETSSGETGLASSPARNVHRSVPGRQAAQISGNPPVTNAASNAAAGSAPTIPATSAGLSGPTTIS